MASGVSFIYASSEKNRMLACRFGEHRDNSRNSQSVFLVVALYNGKSFGWTEVGMMIRFSWDNSERMRSHFITKK